jgi:hypothetical protein
MISCHDCRYYEVGEFAMKPNEINIRTTSAGSEPTMTSAGTRILKRRKNNLFRSIGILMTVGFGLIFLINWYRSLPQGMDCQRMTQRIATAIEDYRIAHGKLPQILGFLDIRKGRYSIDHYEYWFEGLGGPGTLPQGTLVGYCKKPHQPVFSDPWRSIIVFMDGAIVVRRVSESEFQTKISRQLSPEKYWNFP